MSVAGSRTAHLKRSIIMELIGAMRTPTSGIANIWYASPSLGSCSQDVSRAPKWKSPPEEGLPEHLDLEFSSRLLALVGRRGNTRGRITGDAGQPGTSTYRYRLLERPSSPANPLFLEPPRSQASSYAEYEQFPSSRGDNQPSSPQETLPNRLIRARWPWEDNLDSGSLEPSPRSPPPRPVSSPGEQGPLDAIEVPRLQGCSSPGVSPNKDPPVSAESSSQESAVDFGANIEGLVRSGVIGNPTGRFPFPPREKISCSSYVIIFLIDIVLSALREAVEGCRWGLSNGSLSLWLSQGALGVSEELVLASESRPLKAFKIRRLRRPAGRRIRHRWGSNVGSLQRQKRSRGMGSRGLWILTIDGVDSPGSREDRTDWTKSGDTAWTGQARRGWRQETQGQEDTGTIEGIG
ncbi:hypothetical protein Efla_003379 [Eimeria flavescens]